jgi:Flp pilus assembly protein TadG
MPGLLRKLWKDRRGNALMIAGASLPLIVGSAGLATDTIQWTVWKRQLQRAADSAAFAGVYAKVQGQNVTACDASSPVGHDLQINNNVLVGNSNTTCAVENSPSSGAYATDPMAVRVTLAVQKKLGFSSMFMSAAPRISAVATATIVPAGEYCVVSLENTSATGITATGNADVDLGCGMITNSTSMTAAVATGSSEVNASPIAAVGGIAASDNWSDGTVLQPFTLAQEDPFANVAPPAFPSGNCPNITIGTGDTITLPTTSTNTAGLPANTYCIGNLTVRGNLTLPDGVYLLDGGSINFGAQSNVTCAHCTFVLSSRTAATNPGSIGNMDINAGATLDLTSTNSGTYQGILVYQDRRALSGTSASRQSTVNGNATSSLAGAFYFPSQQLTFNGTAGMTTDCLQLVARTVLYSGNMHISNTCDADSGANSFTGRKVRLVG